jgi:hypothetical protein
MTNICTIDVDHAESASADIDGEIDTIYYDATETAQGWFMSILVDCDSGGFCESPVLDDGPYASRDKALLGALNFVIEWFSNNHPQRDIEYTPYSRTLLGLRPPAEGSPAQ